MNKLFTFLTTFLVCASLTAQKPEAVFTKVTDTAPVLDGVIDAVWDNATEYKVEKDYTNEAPTVGNSYFKAMWADSGIWVLVMVDDDIHFPFTAGDGTQPWTYDKVEIYFDVNDGNLEDGKGPGAGGGSSDGHHQFAPDIDENANGEIQSANNGAGTPYNYAIKVANPSYVIEYYIPMSSLMDENGFVMAQTAQFGFDINITDRDASNDNSGGRARKMWSNIGAIGENWNNMNDAGLATLDGASDLIYVDEISLSAPANTIDVDNGTLQITAAIVPANATNQNLKWTADPAKAVTISKTGLVTAVRDGEVTITAESTDGGYIDASITITISNQILTIEEVNEISNPNFDDIDEATTAPLQWGGWIDGGWGEPYATEEGAAKLVPSQASESGEAWHYQFNQANLSAEADVDYILRFKAWGSEARVLNFDFEDIAGNGYRRYGISPDANAVQQDGEGNGNSEWNVDLTTDPQWFEQNVKFTLMEESTIQKFGFFISNALGTVYIDSILLVTKADYDNMGSGTPVQKVQATTMSVYPNPAANTDVLTVVIDALNTEVAIYNAVGQKVMEQVSNGNTATFNVSTLQKGVYLIQLEDGSSQKFIRQ